MSLLCRHPREFRTHTELGYHCGRCLRFVLAPTSKRGRLARARGIAFERDLAKRLAGRRTGHHGGKEDVQVGTMFTASAKVGNGTFSDRYWRWLQSLPRTEGRVPILGIGDAPGPGHPRRVYVVVALADWEALHGRSRVVPGPVALPETSTE